MSASDVADEGVTSIQVKREMAKRFRFRLDVVERVRRQERDQHRRIVAEAVRAVRQLEDHLASIGHQMRRRVDEMILAQSHASLDVALVRTQEYHRNWLHRQVVNARVELERRQDDLTSKRGELAEATMQLRVIEKLRERQWQRHVMEVKREEQSISDEIAVTRFVRASSALTQGSAD